MSQLRKVPIGEVLEMRRTSVDIELDETYQPVGLRAFGRGIFDYPTTKGVDLSKVRYFELPPEAVIVSNIKGWEGAVAVTDGDEKGRIASSRFLTYMPSSVVDPSFVRHWLLSDDGMGVLDRCSPGSADRNRTLSRRSFEASLLPLPPIDKQRRIAAHLDDLAQSVSDFEASSAGLPPGTLPILIRDALARLALPMTTVGDLVTVANETIHPGDPLQGASAFVGLEHIEPHTGQLRGSRPIYEETGRKFLFRPGQLTFGYLRPYLNKVWLADRTGLCSVEQFVLDPVAGVNADLLGHLLRSAYVLDRAVEATNRLQLPRLSLKTLLAMPVPDIRRTEADVVGQVGLLRDRFAEIHRLGLQRASLIGGLLPAARNEIFSAMR